MRVLELFGEPISHGGQEAFVINVLKHINMQGMTIDFLTPYYCDNSIYEKEIIERGGKVISLNVPFQPGKNRINIVRPLYKYFRINDYDVVHIHSGSISVLMWASIVAWKCKIKRIIVHSHCAADKRTWKYRAIRLFSLPILKFAPTNYCACSKIAGEWKFSSSICKKKLIVLNNGVDIEEFSFDKETRKKIRHELNIDESTFVLGHVGRFSFQKNHEFLIRVFEEVKRKMMNVKLILIGTGELMDEIQAQVHELNLSDSVLFLGNVDNVSEFMQAMDVFILPSRYEGLPIVGVEAQTAGLPIIVSENVSKELKLVDDLQYLSLGAGYEKWADEILKCFGRPRVCKKDEIRNAGYDICNTARTIRQLYFSEDNI